MEAIEVLLAMRDMKIWKDEVAKYVWSRGCF